jgi:6-phosphogluconolactonase
MAEKVEPNIVKVASGDDLAHKAFRIFAQKAEESIKRNGVFRVAVSGGHTPEKFFNLLAEAVDFNWPKIHIFWVDERYVPPTDENSNYHLAETTFLTQVPIPSENVHRIPTEASDYEFAASQYELTIRKAFDLRPNQVPEFDLMILGLGSDGHIGSLFPNSVSAFDTAHLATVVYVMDDKLNRITLTYPVMRAARHLMVLVSGLSKANIVKEVFECKEPDQVKYPVHSLWPILDKITWIMDDHAGKLLKKS